MTDLDQLRFEAEIDRWLLAEFGWQRDPDDLIF